MSKEKIYLFNQNNSFGYFVINDTLCPKVYIMAKNCKEANKKAKSVGIYFNGVANDIDCPCCGDRWLPVDEDDVVKDYTIMSERMDELLTKIDNAIGEK